MYQLKELINIIGGKLLSQHNKDAEIVHLATDSRQLIFPEKSVFIALIGDRHDGHHYLKQTYQKGVRSFIVSKTIDVTSFKNANIIVCKSGFEALHKIAAYHRKSFSIPILAITGSNGKTIIKEWLFQILNDHFKTYRSPKSFNSQVGVPLSVWGLKKEHNLALIEAGISKKKEMTKLRKVILPTDGLFTNIGSAHGSGFEKIETKIKEKLKLFSNVNRLFICLDHELIISQLTPVKGRKLITWSMKRKNADLFIKNIKSAEGKTRISGLYKTKKTSFTIPFTDEASIENAIHCALIALEYGLTSEELNQKMQQLSAVSMRLELKEGLNNCQIISDIYNADLESLQVALNYQYQQSADRKRTVIISDLLESNLNEKELNQRIAVLLKEKSIDRLITVGLKVINLGSVVESISDISHFNSTEELLSHIKQINFQNESILLKGARQFQFEKISQFLAAKTHITQLEINMNALGHNLRYFSNKLNPQVKLMVMLKAFGYGSGSSELARFLEYQKLDYLAVAYLDEGIALRKAGVQSKILVLHPQSDQFSELADHNLEVEIYSYKILEDIISFYQQNQPIPIHLKLDTGMHRLGFLERDLDLLIQKLSRHPELMIASIFSHLSSADEKEADAHSYHQLQLFESMSNKIIANLDSKPLKHILNSNGVSRFTSYQHDMVRLGIGLYGLGVPSSDANFLEDVFTLKASVIQCKFVSKGEKIGYNRKGKVSRDSRIAIISAGYADGIPRGIGNSKFSFQIHGKKAPTVGNICMDMCMIDVTDIPNAKPGDEVIIFQTKEQINRIASIMNTVAYEIITGISHRVKRVYSQI